MTRLVRVSDLQLALQSVLRHLWVAQSATVACLSLAEVCLWVEALVSLKALEKTLEVASPLDVGTACVLVQVLQETVLVVVLSVVVLAVRLVKVLGAMFLVALWLEAVLVLRSVVPTVLPLA